MFILIQIKRSPDEISREISRYISREISRYISREISHEANLILFNVRSHVNYDDVILHPRCIMTSSCILITPAIMTSAQRINYSAILHANYFRRYRGPLAMTSSCLLPVCILITSGPIVLHKYYSRRLPLTLEVSSRR